MSVPDTIPIDVSLVRRLVAGQFPQWADLPIRPVESSGWDNRTFHLGESMSVRLPSSADYAAQVEKEHFWLPKLAPQLPLAIPVPLVLGEPGEGYPWHWSIYRWLPGVTASVERIADPNQFASALAQFLVALRKIDSTGGPAAGPHNFYRGGALSTYDAETRQAIAALEDRSYAAAVTKVWETALESSWNTEPVWVHGDIAVGNLLIDKGGRLSAVIDFGCCGIGDPACDLAIAWNFFRGQNREAFRSGMSLDAATWARGRGWTLWKALCAPLSGTSSEEVRRVIADLIAER